MLQGFFSILLRYRMVRTCNVCFTVPGIDLGFRLLSQKKFYYVVYLCAPKTLRRSIPLNYKPKDVYNTNFDAKSRDIDPTRK